MTGSGKPPVKRAHTPASRGRKNTPANAVAFQRLARHAKNAARRKGTTPVGQMPNLTAPDSMPGVGPSYGGYGGGA